MVQGDFPLAVLAMENEAEVAADRAATRSVAVEMPVGGDHGDVFVQDVDGEIGEGEMAHGVGGGIFFLVAGEELGAALQDGLADKDAVLGVGGDEGGDVAFVPGIDLGGEDGFDVGLGVGGVKGEGQEKAEQEQSHLIIMQCRLCKHGRAILRCFKNLLFFTQSTHGWPI